ncbi:MAG: hypothetical protein HN347_16370 [Bacteroidetes bacterium]|nr:hypothetical protein [Bacteroidota bacterium]
MDDYIKHKGVQNESDTDIVGILWYDSELSQPDKIEFSFTLFERSPDYGICAEIKMSFNELSKENRLKIWNNYKRLLKFGDSKQREQIEYSLWVDFFEDTETVDEAWENLVGDYQDKDLIRQLLRISGPVPFDKKDLVYMKLVRDKKNHDYILKSLSGSFFDVYGQINIQRARVLLPTLKVNKSTEEYIKLKDCLSRFNTQREYWKSIKK